MVLGCLWDAFGMVLGWFWDGCGMLLGCFWDAFFMVFFKLLYEIWYGASDSCRDCGLSPCAQMSVAAVATRFRAKPIFPDFAFFGIGCIRAWLYSGLVVFGLGCIRAWLYTASECIRPPNAFGRRMHSAADHCIRRPNAFRGRMHSEAVCNQGRMQSSPNAINR